MIAVQARLPAGGQDKQTLVGVARHHAAAAGVTRSALITHIDRIGLPVAIAVRPNARPGSLVVTAGKGRTPEDATTGALMEAVELAAAASTAHVTLVRTTYREMITQNGDGPASLLDLCPLTNTRIPLDEELTAVIGTTWTGQASRLLPAELVLLPPPRAAASRAYFGASSVGLGCGFSLADALTHAVLEVVERDVLSFHQFNGTSVAIDHMRLDGVLGELAEAVRAADLELAISVLPNELAVPTAHVVVVDHDERSPTFVNGGFASSATLESAIERSLLEAVQSRVCFMHGGREDLPRLVTGHITPPARDRGVGSDPAEVSSVFASSTDLSSVDTIVRTVEAAGVGPVTYVTLRDGTADGVWVVRAVIPGCEAFTAGLLPRVGPRLERWIHG
jgi:thioglycine synthase